MKDNIEEKSLTTKQMLRITALNKEYIQRRESIFAKNLAELNAQRESWRNKPFDSNRYLQERGKLNKKLDRELASLDKWYDKSRLKILGGIDVAREETLSDTTHKTDEEILAEL